jgi:hypothetical protein
VRWTRAPTARTAAPRASAPRSRPTAFGSPRRSPPARATAAATSARRLRAAMLRQQSAARLPMRCAGAAAAYSRREALRSPRRAARARSATAPRLTCACVRARLRVRACARDVCGCVRMCCVCVCACVRACECAYVERRSSFESSCGASVSSGGANVSSRPQTKQHHPPSRRCDLHRQDRRGGRSNATGGMRSRAEVPHRLWCGGRTAPRPAPWAARSACSVPARALAGEGGRSTHEHHTSIVFT